MYCGRKKVPVWEKVVPVVTTSSIKLVISVQWLYIPIHYFSFLLAYLNVYNEN